MPLFRVYGPGVDNGFDLGIGDIAAEGGFYFGEEVAAAGDFGDADVGGANAEVAHLGGEPVFVDFAAAPEVFPGAVRGGFETGDEVATEDAIGFSDEHPIPNVGQEVTDERNVIV